MPPPLAAATSAPYETISAPLRQNGTAADGKAFATKATSYGVALLLIYATGAILYAMANMPFKQVGQGGGVWRGVGWARVGW